MKLVIFTPWTVVVRLVIEQGNEVLSVFYNLFMQFIKINKLL